MRTASARFSFLLSVFLLICGGCQNGFTEFYQPTPVSPYASFQPFSGNVQVYSSNNLQEDGIRLVQTGYLHLGQSTFQTGRRVTLAQIRDQGKNVGADIVLWASSYLGSEQAVVPFVQYHSGTTSTTNAYGTVNANAYGSGGYAYGTANYNGTATMTTPGSFSTTPVNVTVQHYAYGATFWRKRFPPPFGVIVNPLSPELREKLQRNTGAVVSIVVDDSPAFRMNILPGDVIVRFDGLDVESVNSLTKEIHESAGKLVSVTVLRNGQPKDFIVQLGQ